MLGLRKPKTKEKGQSLVEMAVIAPILIFMLIGLFEVGYALWGYMTLLNIDREATRFATIAGALDYSNPDYEDVAKDIGYNEVITHTLLANAEQLKLQEYMENTANNTPDEPKAAMIITHISADTNQPCYHKGPGNKNDCFKADTNKPEDDPDFCQTDYTVDDLILHPEIAGYEHFRYEYPEGQNVFSSTMTGDTLTAKATELKATNDLLNCRLWNKIDNEEFNDFSRNAVVMVEMYYEQPQLLGFPLLSWIANPIPLQVQTTMRVDSTDQALCALYPIAVWEDTIIRMRNTGSPDNLLDPASPRPSGGKGWVAWNPDEQSQDYLVDSFRNPNLATSDFTDPYVPADGSDHDLNAGDWVSTNNGTINSSEIETILKGTLVGQIIMIPVYDTVQGSGSNGAYHIVGFARVRIQNPINLPPGLGGEITATYVEYPVSWACPGNGI